VTKMLRTCERWDGPPLTAWFAVMNLGKKCLEQGISEERVLVDAIVCYSNFSILDELERAVKSTPA